MYAKQVTRRRQTETAADVKPGSDRDRRELIGTKGTVNVALLLLASSLLFL